MIDDIRAFCEVARTSNLSHAARNLGITTPKMTRHIQKLEAHLNTVLFNRTTRLVTLTRAGELFYQEAIEILQHFDAGKKAVSNLSEQISGRVKCGLPAAISQLWIAPQLERFNREYPDIELEIYHGNHLLHLLHEGFDCVLHCGQLPDSDYLYKKIKDWSRITCASPLYLKNNPDINHPNDLNYHQCLDHADNRTRSWRYQVDNKSSLFQISGPVRVNNSLALKTLALEHLGIINLPDFIVQQELKTGKLIEVLSGYKPLPLSMYLVYPRSHRLSKRVECLMNFINSIMIETK